MLNFNFQQSHALGQLHQTLTSSNITRGTPQAGLVQLYKDQNNIIHTLIIVYAKNKQVSDNTNVSCVTSNDKH